MSNLVTVRCAKYPELLVLGDPRVEFSGGVAVVDAETAERLRKFACIDVSFAEPVESAEVDPVESAGTVGEPFAEPVKKSVKNTSKKKA